MKRAVFGSAVALVWCMSTPYAQQQSAPAPEAAHKVFALTGCLNLRADPTEKFILTDASSISQATPAGAAEAAAVGTSGQKSSYELQPVSGVNAQGVDVNALRVHAGQRVDVTVRRIEEVPPAAPTAVSPAIQAAKPTEPALERFTVTAIKRVAGICS